MNNEEEIILLSLIEDIKEENMDIEKISRNIQKIQYSQNYSLNDIFKAIPKILLDDTHTDKLILDSPNEIYKILENCYFYNKITGEEREDINEYIDLARKIKDMFQVREDELFNEFKYQYNRDLESSLIFYSEELTKPSKKLARRVFIDDLNSKINEFPKKYYEIRNFMNILHRNKIGFKKSTKNYLTHLEDEKKELENIIQNRINKLLEKIQYLLDVELEPNFKKIQDFINITQDKFDSFDEDTDEIDKLKRRIQSIEEQIQEINNFF